MRDDILKLIIAPVPTEYTGQLPTDGLDLLNEYNGFGVEEVDGLGRDSVDVHTTALAGQNISVYQATRMQSRTIDIVFDYLTVQSRKTLRDALPWDEPRRLYLVIDEGCDSNVYWIDVYPEKLPLDIHTGVIGSTLTLIAPDPFFRSLNRETVELTADAQTLENRGDTPAWVEFEVEYTPRTKTRKIQYKNADGTEVASAIIEYKQVSVAHEPSIIFTKNGVEKSFVFDGDVSDPVILMTQPGRRTVQCRKPVNAEDAIDAIENYSGELATESVLKSKTLCNDETVNSRLEKRIDYYLDKYGKLIEPTFASITTDSEWPCVYPGETQMSWTAFFTGTLTYYHTFTGV